MNKEKLNKVKNFIVTLFWWAIVGIYTYAYMFYMPKSTFGDSQFQLMFWAINYLAGFYIILKSGGIIK